MLPRKDGTPGHCGHILYHYSLYKAVQDGVCKDFKVLIMFHTDSPNEHMNSGPDAAASAAPGSCLNSPSSDRDLLGAAATSGAMRSAAAAAAGGSAASAAAAAAGHLRPAATGKGTAGSSMEHQAAAQLLGRVPAKRVLSGQAGSSQQNRKRAKSAAAAAAAGGGGFGEMGGSHRSYGSRGCSSDDDEPSDADKCYSDDDGFDSNSGSDDDGVDSNSMAEGSDLGDEGEQQQGESIGDSTSVDELSDSAVLLALARAVARTLAGRVLSFHSRAKVGDGCVTAFATPENQQQLQQQLQEFGADWVQGLRLEGLTAEDGGRQKLLQDFDATPDGEVFTLASCRTIGEGVDTKNANMAFFADPRGSYAATIQPVGRVTRRTPMDGPDAHGIVVLMVHVNMDKYTACSSDAARSAVLRQDLAAGARGDFAVVADFLLALQQDDEAFLTELIERPTKRNRKAREDQQPQQQDDQQGDEQPQQQDTKEGAAGKGGDGQQQQQLLQKQQTGRKPAARRLQYDFSQALEFQQIFALADAQADAAGAPEGSAFLQALLLGTAGTWQEAMLQLLHCFVQEHERLPQTREAYKGQPLGQWCSNRRSQWKKGAMDAELAHQLEAVPKLDWGQQQQQQPKANLTDEQWLQLLREFQQQHHALPNGQHTQWVQSGHLGAGCSRQETARHS